MSIEQTAAELQTDLARLATVHDADRQVVQLARLQAAQAALKLAAVLLEDTDTQAASEVWEHFSSVTTELASWKRSGRGWFEERTVRRGQKTHGPYRYFRWRDEAGATHTQYLGRVDQAAAEDASNTTPIRPLEQDAQTAPIRHDTPPSPARRELVQPVRIGVGKKVHLMLPEGGVTTTLCGRALGPDALRVAFFQYDDCARCRNQATNLDRVCTRCGEPLIQQGEPGLCLNCTLELQRAP